jgi:hypothetical protein
MRRADVLAAIAASLILPEQRRPNAPKPTKPANPKRAKQIAQRKARRITRKQP